MGVQVSKILLKEQLKTLFKQLEIDSTVVIDVFIDKLGLMIDQYNYQKLLEIFMKNIGGDDGMDQYFIYDFIVVNNFEVTPTILTIYFNKILLELFYFNNNDKHCIELLDSQLKMHSK